MTLSLIAGLRVASAAQTSRVVVLRDNSVLPVPACPSCTVVTLGPDLAPLPAPAEGLIVTGHSGSGLFLGTTALDLARTIARLAPNPEFLVLDTCEGIQSELLLELTRAGVHPQIVIGASFALPPGGLDYHGLLARETVDAGELAATVTCCQGGARARQLTMLSARDLTSLPRWVDEASAQVGRCERIQDFVSVTPNLLPMEIAGAGTVLVEVPPRAVPSTCFDARPFRKPSPLRWWRAVLAALVAVVALWLLAPPAIRRWLTAGALIAAARPGVARADEPPSTSCAELANVELPAGWSRLGGDEPWLHPGEANARELIGCPYLEVLDRPVSGHDAVCPASDQLEPVAQLAAAVGDRSRLYFIVDGSEDARPYTHRYIEGVVRLLRRNHADARAMNMIIRFLRARSRADCARDTISKVAPATDVVIGNDRVEQLDGRRGTIVYASVRPRPLVTARPAPTVVSPTGPATSTPLPACEASIARPQAADAIVRPRRARSRLGLELRVADAIGGRGARLLDVGPELELAAVLDERSWMPQPFTVRVGVAMGSSTTSVRVLELDVPERVRALWLRAAAEVEVRSQVRAGVEGGVGRIDAELRRAGGAPMRELRAAEVGPTVALRLIGDENAAVVVELDYAARIVISPIDADAAIGVRHVVSLALRAQPLSF